MKHIYKILLVISCLTIFNFSLAKPVSKKIFVVTTLPVLKDLVVNVGKDLVEVESLAEPNQDAHFVQPKPTLMKKVAKADVFVEVGLSLELWAQKIVDSTSNTRVQIGQPGRVIAASGVAALEIPQVLSRDFGDVHPQGNPHVWLDPVNIKQMAINIKNALVLADPIHKESYEKNLLEYQNKIDVFLFGQKLIDAVGSKKLTRLCEQNELMSFLQKKKLDHLLDGWLKKAVPLRGQEIVTYHRTWAYLSNRLGIKVAAEIEDKPGIPPSAKHRDEVVQLMKHNKVATILMEIYYDRLPADYIAKQTKASVVQVPIDVGAVKAAGNYFELMDYIVDQLLATRKV